MFKRTTRSDEADALERVVNAARDVQAASAALQQHFRPDGDARPSIPELVRFEAALLELEAARADFDALFTFGHARHGPQTRSQG